jgi:hypothetical protein
MRMIRAWLRSCAATLSCILDGAGSGQDEPPPVDRFLFPSGICVRAGLQSLLAPRCATYSSIRHHISYREHVWQIKLYQLIRQHTPSHQAQYTPAISYQHCLLFPLSIQTKQNDNVSMTLSKCIFMIPLSGNEAFAYYSP